MVFAIYVQSRLGVYRWILVEVFCAMRRRRKDNKNKKPKNRQQRVSRADYKQHIYNIQNRLRSSSVCIVHDVSPVPFFVGVGKEQRRTKIGPPSRFPNRQHPFIPLLLKSSYIEDYIYWPCGSGVFAVNKRNRYAINQCVTNKL